MYASMKKLIDFLISTPYISVYFFNFLLNLIVVGLYFLCIKKVYFMVIVKIIGGLGNQMFQYAYARKKI